MVRRRQVGPSPSGDDLLLPLAALAVAYQVQCRLSGVAPVRAKGFDHTTQGAYAAADAYEVMTLLHPTRAIAEATRASHLQNPKLTPLLEPLIPALTRAVHFWGTRAEVVSVIHDEQSALTPERIADIAGTFAASRPGRQLVAVRQVDSRGDARVQLADFVAGIARRLASDKLNDRQDTELFVLLSPLIGPESIWPDHMP